MARITELRIKGEDGTFTETYPIGAEATNVITSENVSIETAFNNLASDLSDLETDLANQVSVLHVSIETAFNNLASDISDLETDLANQVSVLQSGKANVYHASTETTYGAGSETLYGHLKISDNYSEEGSDPTLTALSIAGALALFKKVVNFQILDDEKLYSALNTAYYNSDKASRLYLVSDYFEISDDGTTLTIITD